MRPQTIRINLTRDLLVSASSKEPFDQNSPRGGVSAENQNNNNNKSRATNRSKPQLAINQSPRINNNRTTTPPRLSIESRSNHTETLGLGRAQYEPQPKPNASKIQIRAPINQELTPMDTKLIFISKPIFISNFNIPKYQDSIRVRLKIVKPDTKLTFSHLQIE